MTPESTPLGVRVLAQPNDTVCGPTCLHAVYRFFGREVPLERIIAEIPELPQGGTLAVLLGCHAISQGFSATIYTNNLQTFDPTWFHSPGSLAERLEAQMQVKADEKLHTASRAYIQFIKAGGQIFMQALTATLLRNLLLRKLPVLCGLSATYLYETARELPDGTPDSIRGDPCGHFVIVQGYLPEQDQVLVADPLPDNPRFEKPYYSVAIEKFLAAVHLGVLTYDANLLVISPAEEQHTHPFID